ncbi:uncharacterized protein B0T15DRAFT_278201 [Chaetomium strumarium]|uniref:Uncharacterized protein n=1 Tax=Chaetomium strumarium TaxID=1170767 RepID=A0AAJ0GP65_9PEZI|nr:hypothetical protein B0T15DRAFT_278201 [Chaetomium strumarium]
MMPASRRTTNTKRTILRFELESICIDDRPNVFREPQLVLKPQLELAPRRPYTGSRPRMPLWRHFLMVHVKDKADELVKLDLASFKEPSADATPVQRCTVTCFSPECSLLFRYTKEAENDGSSTLGVTLKNSFELDTLLRELSSLGIKIDHEQADEDRYPAPGSFPAGSLPGPNPNMSPGYRPSSNPRHLYSSSPPLTAASASQGLHWPYLESHLHGVQVQRTPSQPLGYPAGLQASHRPWSPAFVPLRPASALGVPGVLGEGIYKVSKIGSVSSSRPRVRRTSTVLEPHGPRLYTVSRHFDKTLNRADVLLSSRAQHLSRGLSLDPRAGKSANHPTGSPVMKPLDAESHRNLGQADPVMDPLTRAPGVLEGVPAAVRHQSTLRRLQTIDDISRPSMSTGFDGVDFQHCSENARVAFSQPETSSKTGGSVDDASIPASSQTLFDLPLIPNDDWLLRVSEIQLEGLCEARRIWDEFMERSGVKAASTESLTDLSKALAKFESEFTRRWDEAVSGTLQQMRDIRSGPYVL